MSHATQRQRRSKDEIQLDDQIDVAQMVLPCRSGMQ